MRVKYIRKVRSPGKLAGDVGDEKDLPLYAARQLLREGYVTEIEEQGKGQVYADTDEGTDFTSEGLDD
jgi:hypothetical protein